jgi:hypothetical protein
MLGRFPLGFPRRSLLAVALVVLGTIPRGALAQGVSPPGIDTLFARSADEVIDAVATALSLRDLMAGASPASLVSAMQDAMERTQAGIVRTASQAVDSTGLAQLVDPAAVRFIGPSGGRYVLDVTVTEVTAGETRVRVAPLLVAMIPNSDSPLGGRPLPSSGMVERQTLATIASSLPGNQEDQ